MFYAVLGAAVAVGTLVGYGIPLWAYWFFCVRKKT